MDSVVLVKYLVDQIISKNVTTHLLSTVMVSMTVQMGTMKKAAARVLIKFSALQLQNVIRPRTAVMEFKIAMMLQMRKIVHLNFVGLIVVHFFALTGAVSDQFGFVIVVMIVAIIQTKVIALKTA